MKDILKLIVCWAAFVVAMFMTGVINGISHFASVQIPDNTPIQIRLLAQLGAGAMLVLGLWPLARRLAAPALLRSLAVGGFFFVALGVNGVIETRFFSSLADNGIASTEVFYLLEAALLGGAFGLLFGETGKPAGLAKLGWAGWAGRGIVAWLGWLVIYFAFGAFIAPIVVPIYKTMTGFHIPPLGTIVTLQLVRSVFFLACSLPLIALWKGSRTGLWLALGLAHTVVVGWYGLAGATFWPWVLRITHGVEMMADGFAYAGLLVALFAPRTGTAAEMIPDVMRVTAD
jgi:hypothetical protein